MTFYISFQNEIVLLKYTISVLPIGFQKKKCLTWQIVIFSKIAKFFATNIVHFFIKSDNKLEAWWAEPVLLTFHSALRKLNTQPSIHVDASYQVSVHLARQFQRFLRYWPIRNKNCLWWPCLLTDRDEMSNLHRWPSIDASCHVSVNLAKRFQKRRFKKIGQSETRIACGEPCLVMDHNKMCTL